MHRVKPSGRRAAASRIRSFTSLFLAAVFAALLVSTGVARAAAKIEAAPANPYFVQWQAEREAALASGKAAAKITGGGVKLGYAPHPVDRSYMKNVTSDLAASTSTWRYYSKYDLRDHRKLSPIRDQSYCGSCWAFGTFASLESYLLPGKQTDFAESHLIDMHGFDAGPCDGGDYNQATAYLARWGGPVPEKEYPYQYLLAGSPLPATNASARMEPYHVQDVQISGTTSSNVKAALMAYGAVSIAFHWDKAYYKSSTYGYYCPVATSANHGVAIVGWDDNYSKNNFPDTPMADGAYLVRNSWGTSWGDNGYFWMSYFDASLEDTIYVFNSAAATDNYNWIYQYDTLGDTQDVGFLSSTAWMANVFKGNPLGTKIAAVSFYALTDNTSYEVYVYDNVTTTTNKEGLPIVKPRSGKKVATASGTLSSGYHTVKLNTIGKVTSGKNFSIVVKITTPGYNYPIAIEYPFEGYSSRATAIQGQSYISNNGSTWVDLTLDYDANSNVCLKAFAKK